jgi:Ca2+-binding RTX toxin-like protein
MKAVLRLLATAALLVVALPVTSASAGNAGGKLRGYFDYLVYTALAGETNDVTVTGSAGTYTVHDTVGVTAGADCSQVDPMTATCTQPPSYPFLGIQVHTLDKNDIVHASTDLDVTLNGGTGNDQLYGGTEPDQLVGGTGADLLSGGGGVDTADYSAETNPLSVTLDGQANDGEAGEGDNVPPNVENVIGGAADDHITGSVGKNTLDGGGGNNSITSLGGADTLLGGDGNDTLAGGGGADSIYGGSGNNALSGGPGADTLHSNGGTTADTDNCGGGTDSATVDAHDTVAANCESVTVV